MLIKTSCNEFWSGDTSVTAVMYIDKKQQSNGFRNESDTIVAREIADMKPPATSRISTVLLTGSVKISNSPAVLPKRQGTNSGS